MIALSIYPGGQSNGVVKILTKYGLTDKHEERMEILRGKKEILNMIQKLNSASREARKAHFKRLEVVYPRPLEDTFTISLVDRVRFCCMGEHSF
jgi:hypothetical protein